MPPLVAMKERAASRSPASFGIALDGGRASVPLRLDDETQLEDAILAAIGQTSTMGDGRLKRTCPLRHGRFKGYYAERVASGEGIGTGTFHDTRLVSNENGNSLDDFALYDKYVLGVDFMPRPYNVKPDVDITFGPLTWSDSRTSTRVSVQTTEYKRFVEWDLIDDDSFLEADQGCMYVATSDAAIQPVGTPPHGAAFVGKPRLPIKQSKLFATWYGVPHYYATHPSSWLRKYKNTVNQLPFLNYPAGSLLYRGYTVVKKWTPFQTDEEPANSLYLGGLKKMMDVRLEWGLRDGVTVTGGPTEDGPGGAAPNFRLYRSPWNSAPTFLDTLWWSVIMVNPADPNNKVYWTPIYPSFPHQLLFTDPAV